MEKLDKDKSEKDIFPKLEMSELKKRHLLDDHSWGYVWGLENDFVDFCTKAKFQDKVKIEATFIDELRIGAEYGKQYTPENPMYPDKVNPSLTTILDLEFIDTVDFDYRKKYVFIVKNMVGLPLTCYFYKDGKECKEVPLNPPEETEAILGVYVIKDTSEISEVIVSTNQEHSFRRNPNLSTEF